MDRELLTDEQIAEEKKEAIKIKQAKLKKDIEEMISEIESESCEGRVSGKNHYMRKIDSDGVARKYTIKCEFCDILGIEVDGYNVVDLDRIIKPDDFRFTRPDFFYSQEKWTGLGGFNMTEDKDDNGENIPETTIPATILTPMLNSIKEGGSPRSGDKPTGFIQRISRLFSNLFSRW